MKVKQSQKLSKSKLIKKLDALFSLRVRERDGVCLVCGKTENLQCAHLISRTYKHLRWDERNAITLCYKHHIHWAHKEPLEFAAWVEEKLPETYNYIILEKYKDLPPLSLQDLLTLYEVLKDNKLADCEYKYPTF